MEGAGAVVVVVPLAYDSYSKASVKLAEKPPTGPAGYLGLLSHFDLLCTVVQALLD